MAIALVAGVSLVALAPIARAADLVSYQATPLKGPDCILDVGASVFAQNVQPVEPPHPTLPIGHYYAIARYLGDGSVGVPVASDYGHFPATYPGPSYRGMAVTGLDVPEPTAAWQRSIRADASVDSASAVQMHCFDAGSFINTWTFPAQPINGGGPHVIYGYSFDDAVTPRIFDANPATDFVLQVSAEVPWFASWPDPAAPAGIMPDGQLNLFAYFRDRTSGKTFALLLALFDNLSAADPTYPSFVNHDGATPFASMPVNASGRYGVLSPYSSVYSGTPWTGLRFFRMHVTQSRFALALADVNAFCRAHATLRYCAPAASGDAYSGAVTDYELTDFGVIHEVDRGGNGNLSMGVHVFDLGAWNFR